MGTDPLTVAAALLGAIVGAAASTVGSMAMARASRVRAIRAGQLRNHLPRVRLAVDNMVAQLDRGAGPVALQQFVAELEAIEREALTAGWKDARRAAPLVNLAHEIWRLECGVWEDTSIGRKPLMDTTQAIELQLRLLVRAGGGLNNYELWLRRHLLKPWWRRKPPLVPWPERYG